jgi:hypothetical protein
MWRALKKILKDCMTEQDGVTWCPFRIAGCGTTATSIPTFIWLAVWSALHGQPVDLKDFAIAFGGMMTGISVLAGTVAFKIKSEIPPGGQQ